MEQIEIFQDERWANFCCLCGGVPNTRDHVPSKMLLDSPYPAQIPVVPACYTCHNSISKDEEYLACAIDCVMKGDVRSPALRKSTLKSFEKSPSLLAMLEARRKASDGKILWQIDLERVSRVLLKLGRGLAFYEGWEVRADAPETFSFTPLGNMTATGGNNFEVRESHQVWPELGSRAFLRAVEGSHELGLNG